MSQLENEGTSSSENQLGSLSTALIEHEEESSPDAPPVPLSQVVSALNRKLRRLEIEAKLLRREVRHLESTHNALAMAADTEEQLLARDHSFSVLPITPSLIDELSTKAGILTEEGLKHEALFSELSSLQQATVRAAASCNEAEEEYNDLVNVLGGLGEKGQDPPSYAGVLALNSQVHASHDLADLVLQRDGLRAVLDAQNVELLKLAEEVSSHKEAKKQKAELQEELAHLLQQLSALRLEKKNVKNVIHRGEWTLLKPSPSLENRIREAIADRQVATVALEKAATKGKNDELCSLSRATRLLMLEKRLNMIAETVSGGLENAEPVDADIFEAVRKEVAALRVLRLEGEAQATFLDQDIEDINYRTNSIFHITTATRKEKEKIQNTHQKYMNLVEKSFNKQKETHEANIQQLQSEVAALRRQRRHFTPAKTFVTPPPPPHPPRATSSATS